MAMEYDVVILGCGPGGERAAILAARAGKKVAVIERAGVVGGTAVNWGTIPSKTLRESALFVYAHTHQKLHGIQTDISAEITVADFMHRERKVVQRELELINRALARNEIDVFHGHGRFMDEHHLAVMGTAGQTRMVLRGDTIVIATGTSPNHPDDVPFDSECVFDSNTILELPRMPRSMLVLGAGVIGIEYACIFKALGLDVTLLDTRSRLLPYLDQEIAKRLQREMQRLGMLISHDEFYSRIERVDGNDRPFVRFTTTGGTVLEADVLLYSVGRDGNTRDLGLESIGIKPNERGLISVNQHYQTENPHIYAIGDVIGYPALASTSMEQGRRAIRHAFDLPGIQKQTDVLPFAIYSIPEVSYIGETEEGLATKGRSAIVGRGLYALNPRGQIIGDEGGMLKLLFDSETMELLGAHVIGTSASELIHIGQAFLATGATATVIAESLYNYPTLSDLYRHAAMEALGRKMRMEQRTNRCD